MTTSLDDLAVAAIGYSPSDEESQAAAHPPYPMPTALVPFQDAARTALRTRLTQGPDPDPFCSRRLYESALRFSACVPTVISEHTDFNVGDAVCMLLAGGLIPVATAQRAIEVSASDLAPCFLQRAIVYRLLADGNLPGATQAAASPHFGDAQWVGWRAIGEHHAAHADARAFLTLWPNYASRHERHWMDTLRRQLVKAVSRRHGWRDALALTRDKRIGTKGHVHGMAFIALQPLAKETAVRELDHLLATAPELAEPDTSLDALARLQLLVDAMRASTPHAPADDPPALDAVLARIIAVDATVSKEQSRRRDWLLMDCWPLIGDAATLKRVRAAIRAPSNKRELAKLAKDIPAASPDSTEADRI
ncbi:hypothetical protein J2W24_002559 [Variovorax boronicumulans]|uniref:hypothetical protein n=1 Tax=Variovorax boronicumulans TaxID=436515 RepID=UPI00277D302E|nr:hypothetical protein [Variovorax boronicumulans]MDP9916910.1 hypothetical protein [Variovorax boronicumulans]